jgi:inosine kinase
MKFPGIRKYKHYFPVSERIRDSFTNEEGSLKSVYILGVDQLLVDIEANVTNEFLEAHNLKKGESQLIDDLSAEKIYTQLKEMRMITGEFPGGAIGNTLHNYAKLSDDSSVLLGSIPENIKVGDYAFKYINNTSTQVDLNHVVPCDGYMGRAFCFITEDGERTFGVSKGCMNEFRMEKIPRNVVEGASVIVLSAFLLRDKSAPMFEATLEVAKIGKKFNIPIVLTLGTSHLVEEIRPFITEFIKEYVNVLAMNDIEAKALTLLDDPLTSIQETLDITDFVFLTVGEKGIYIGAHADEQTARKTKYPLHTKTIVEYNKFEFSRAMKKSECENPLKIYTHINPYLGGPGLVKNTNGAGDAALAALLHDMAANQYHKSMVPNSPKHKMNYLTYSSIAQISKYSNRVSYQVLRQNSARLSCGLPEKEEALQESHWEL